MAASRSHSANVRMELQIHGIIVPIGQLGMDFLIPQSAVAISPGIGILRVTIDGHEESGEVELPDGIQPLSKRTRIFRIQAVNEAA